MGTPRARSPEKLLKFLLENVYIDGDCRIWAGQYNGGKRGHHPQICVNRRTRSVRRVLFELLGKEIPPGHLAANTCNNVKCVAPKHLTTMSRSEVSKRAVKMGRIATGPHRARQIVLSNVGRAKFQVTELPNVLRMKAAGMTDEKIAAHYKIGRGHFSRSVRAWQAAGFTGWTA